MDMVKFINIDDKLYSLRDIREKIVYANWSDPRVMYGFFLGELGGPSLQNIAFTGKNVQSLLRTNAEEFVNSLRGFEIHKGRPQVSQLYANLSPTFFPNFQSDVKAHFKTYMRPEVYAEVEKSGDLQIAKYEHRIASVDGGKSAAHISSQITVSVDPNTLESRFTAEDIASRKNALGFLLRDYTVKRERLKEMGLLESEVIIEDIETVDSP